MTKKSRQKFKYLKNKKSFYGEIKSIFHNFKGLSVAKNCIRPESAHLNPQTSSIYKMVKHTLKILQILLQDFYGRFDHFVNTRGYRFKFTIFVLISSLISNFTTLLLKRHFYFIEKLEWLLGVIKLHLLHLFVNQVVMS